MHTVKPLAGSCLCGQIHYELAAPPLLTAICHFAHCQKQSGSAFSVNLVVQRSDLAVSGDLASYTDRGESGTVIYRRFCAACGSPIMTEPSDKPEIAYLKAGTLDDKGGIDPKVQIWCSSAQPWWSSQFEIPAFDRNLSQ
ncbi:GFA family protein [Sphingobium sp. EM0848]|uniref:GFA family protein n=1 Tax=Sphingobium sp. EM0848 TaxID=2743473 RepID=UPI00159C55D6|nr:GFA family protein [Sphingobium sp. EM0848]